MGLEFQPLRTTNDLYFVSCFMLLANRISLVDEILISHTIHRAESLSSTRRFVALRAGGINFATFVYARS